MSAYSVFLASRFQAFQGLRAALRHYIDHHSSLAMKAVDLNDDLATTMSVRQRCLDQVLRSEFMILILGDDYGFVPEGEQLSITHQEYRAALESERIGILVYVQGESYDPTTRDFTPSSDPRMAGWQGEVSRNHVLGFLDPSASDEEKGRKIAEDLMCALYQKHLGTLQVREDASDLEDFGDLELSENEIPTIDALDARAATVKGIHLSEPDEAFQELHAVMTQQASVRAHEQLRLSEQAIHIGQYPIAIKHLERALEEQPLNTMANYWLARLYYASNRKSRLELILRHTKIAALQSQQEGRPFRQAANYILAARAQADLAGNLHEALSNAKSAVQAAPNYAQSHLELARVLTLQGDQDAALECVKKAYRIYPPSVREVTRDPRFLPLQRRIGDWRRAMRSNALTGARIILDAEREIFQILGRSDVPPALSPSADIAHSQRTARSSALRQHTTICSLSTALPVNRQLDENQYRTLMNARQELTRALVAWRQATPSDARWQGVTVETVASGGKVRQLFDRLLGRSGTVTQMSPPTPLQQPRTWGRQLGQDSRALQERAERWHQRVQDLEDELAETPRFEDLRSVEISRCIQVFEELTLAQDPNLLPFRTAWSAAPGHLVRCHLNTKSAQLQGRAVDINMVLTSGTLPEPPSHGHALFRCVNSSSQHLVLSRPSAYGLST